MANKDIDKIKEIVGPYSKEALEGRKMFILLRLRQDLEIRKIFVSAIDRIAGELKKAVSISRAKQIARFLGQVEEETGIVRNELTAKIAEYHLAGAEAGSWMNRQITVKLFEKAKLPNISIAKIEKSFIRINYKAVKATQNRVINKLNLSQRIWKTGDNFDRKIKDILRNASATGQDPITTAKMLQQYVKTDAMTLVRNYPDLAKRMSGIPKDLSYEALRLARTEGTAAHGEATIQSAQESPSAIGIQYCLSAAHRIVDICDELAKNDEAGLGPGIYEVNDPPLFPAHPNTMSFLVVKHTKPEDFVKRLKQWQHDPRSVPGLEEWFKKSYNG